MCRIAPHQMSGCLLRVEVPPRVAEMDSSWTMPQQSEIWKCGLGEKACNVAMDQHEPEDYPRRRAECGRTVVRALCGVEWVRQWRQRFLPTPLAC